MNTQQWGPAIQRAKELIRERPDLTVAYKTLVAASVGNKDLAGARRFIEDLWLQYPGRARLDYALALCLKEEKQYEAALARLATAIDRDPGFGEAFVEIGNVYQAKGDLTGGITYFVRYTEKYPGRSNGYVGLGYGYQLAANLEAALVNFQKAIARDPENVTAYRRKSLLCYAMKNFKEFLRACQDVARLAPKKNEDEAFYKNIGNLGMAYAARQQRSQAIQHYQQALELARTVVDKRQQLFYLYEIGDLRIGFAENREALRPLEEAVTISREMKDPFYESWALLKLSEVYYRLSDRPAAVDHYKKASDLHQRNKDERGICYALKIQGDQADMIGETDTAIDFYKQALARARALKNQADSDQYQGWILSALGLMYARKKEYPTALGYFNNAYETATAAGDDPRVEETLGRLGSTYLWTGRLAEARSYLGRALDWAQRTEQNEQAGFWLNRLGDVYLQLAHWQKANASYHQALSLGRHLGYARITREALKGLGATAEARGHFQEALGFYGQAIGVIEAERDQLLLEQEKTGFLEDKLDVYERVVNVLLDLHDRERDPKYLAQAFHYSERAKAQGFLQSLPQGQLLKYLKKTSEAYKDWNAGYEKEQNEIYQQLLDERAQLEAMIDRKEDAPKIKDRKNKIAALERERLDKSETAQLRFLNMMRERIPGLADLYKPKILDVSGVQRVLGEQEVLIEYHMQQGSTVAFIIGKKRIERVRMPFGRDQREELMKIIRQVNRTAGGDPETEADPFGKLRTLYEQVFAPVAPYLEPSSELIMVRDDVLNYLPFGLLVPEPGGDRPRFLIEQYPISYVDSASLLDAALGTERQPRGRAGLDLLALGHPDFGGTLPPLPHTEGEVEKIRAHFKRAVVRTRSAATEAAFKSEAGRARLLHLATHGALDAETVWHSKIELALAPAIDQQGEDGHLYTYEIFNLDLVADLVVLSACQSGLGKLRPGEGLVGMSRAFLYAGAPSLVATLWSIPDRATAELMGKFYGYLRQGLNKRRALQRAQTDLVQDGYTDPFYWAAFILIGDSSPIKLTEASSPSLPMTIILPITLLVLLVSVIFLRKITTKRAPH
jgi:CHAT domain-containing protein/Tfp pilus assembly protein PilF